MSDETNNTIEISEIDTRYKLYRLPNERKMQWLLSSIGEKGIEEPISGILEDKFILLDGFKRLYCAIKLNFSSIPFMVIASNEKEGILKLVKETNKNKLHILEQAKFITTLRNEKHMTINDIAKSLVKSPSWVSVRISFLKRMSVYVQRQVFTGKFPIKNALYTLNHFNRLNKNFAEEIDNFVRIVSGKGFTTREIDLLARGYFSENGFLKDLIKGGDLNWALEKFKENYEENTDKLTTLEKEVIKNLGIVNKCMHRLILRIPKMDKTKPSCIVLTSITAENIASILNNFSIQINTLIKVTKND